VRKSVNRATVITKLSPNVSHIPEFAKAAEEAGSDALSLINTIPAMAIDIETWKPRLANVTGGLSGPAIKPIALRMVWEASRAVTIPVIGIGGIIDYKDAIEFMLGGATAIEIGTGNFVNPRATVDVVEGVGKYLREKGIRSVRDIIGRLHGSAPLTDADN
jgi:dihydroorotate dehydrogenase (NAD+) catalytic subunit